MIGITSYGAYIPRLRLDRMSIFNAMGWFAPAIMMVAQGERSMCNWDEDPLTMAVAASRDCLGGRDKQNLDGLHNPAVCRPAKCGRGGLSAESQRESDYSGSHVFAESRHNCSDYRI